MRSASTLIIVKVRFNDFIIGVVLHLGIFKKLEESIFILGVMLVLVTLFVHFDELSDNVKSSLTMSVELQDTLSKEILCLKVL